MLPTVNYADGTCSLFISVNSQSKSSDSQACWEERLKDTICIILHMKSIKTSGEEKRQRQLSVTVVNWEMLTKSGIEYIYFP